MSILLDALKKSEAQRQLGETPTLQTPVPGGESGPENDQVWIPALMLLLTAVVITWIGLKQYKRPDTAENLPAAPVVAVQQDQVSQPVDSGQVTEAAESARTPVMDFAVSDTQEQATNTQKVTTPAIPEADTSNTTDALRSYSAEPSKAETPISEQKAYLAMEEAPGRKLDGDDEPASGEKNEQHQAEPFEPETISYWQLPQSLRNDLPEIRITVLVYSEQAEDRFLLVNGERKRENEELGGGLVLEEIRRDRAIFTYQKYRFHLKS